MGGWWDDSQICIHQFHHNRDDIDIIHPDSAAATAAAREQVASNTNLPWWVNKKGGGYA